MGPCARQRAGFRLHRAVAPRHRCIVPSLPRYQEAAQSPPRLQGRRAVTVGVVLGLKLSGFRLIRLGESLHDLLADRWV